MTASTLATDGRLLAHVTWFVVSLRGFFYEVTSSVCIVDATALRFVRIYTWQDVRASRPGERIRACEELGLGVSSLHTKAFTTVLVAVAVCTCPQLLPMLNADGAGSPLGGMTRVAAPGLTRSYS